MRQYVWHQQAELVEAPVEPESVPLPRPLPPSSLHRRHLDGHAYAPAGLFSFCDPTPKRMHLNRRRRGPAAAAHRLGGASQAWPRAGSAWLALVLVIGWSGMRFRQEIATLWPQSASLYAALGKPVNTTGLAIGHVSYRNETQDGQPVLAITGQLDEHHHARNTRAHRSASR
jgi:hypothetical protein